MISFTVSNTKLTLFNIKIWEIGQRMNWQFWYLHHYTVLFCNLRPPYHFCCLFGRSKRFTPIQILQIFNPRLVTIVTWGPLAVRSTRGRFLTNVGFKDFFKMFLYIFSPKGLILEEKYFQYSTTPFYPQVFFWNHQSWKREKHPYSTPIWRKIFKLHKLSNFSWKNRFLPLL